MRIATLLETCSRGITPCPGEVIAAGMPAGVGMARRRRAGWGRGTWCASRSTALATCRTALSPRRCAPGPAGHPLQATQWPALFVAAGTPRAKVPHLRAAARQAAVEAQVVATIARAGSPAAYLDAPAFPACRDVDARLMIQALRLVGKVA